MHREMHKEGYVYLVKRCLSESLNSSDLSSVEYSIVNIAYAMNKDYFKCFQAILAGRNK